MMLSINQFLKINPVSWSSGFRILNQDEKLQCDCGKFIKYNGCGSHSKICNKNIKNKFELEAKKRRKGNAISYRLSFSKFFKNKKEADIWNKKYWRIRRKIDRRKICPICGKIYFSLLKYSLKTKKTCSKKCAYKLMVSNRDYSVNAMQLKDLHKFRRENNIKSPSAWNKGLTGNEYIKHYVRDGETIYAAKKRFTTGLYYQKTSIEIKIENFLIEKYINYRHSYFLEGRQYDFNILGKYIIIEADGDYWHGRPGTKYHLQERQILKQKDDRIKDEIAKKYNNIILRFWEYDINQNFDWVCNSILKIIKGNKNEVDEKICEIKENYTSGSGPYVRCYNPK